MTKAKNLATLLDNNGKISSEDLSNTLTINTQLQVGNSSLNIILNDGNIQFSGSYLFFGNTISASLIPSNLNSFGVSSSPNGALITLTSGNTTVAPIKLSPGDLLNTPGNGSIEYNNLVFATLPTSGRGIIPSVNFLTLTSNGASVSGTNNFFGNTCSFNLEANSVYEFEASLYFIKNGSSTVTFTIVNSVVPVFVNATYYSSPFSGLSSVQAASTAGIVASTANVALPVTPSLSAAATFNFEIKGYVYANTTTASTLRLQVTLPTGNTITPLRGSYMKMTKLSLVNIGNIT